MKRFEKDLHRTLWGFEEWLVSVHPSSPSRIVGGGCLCDEMPGFPLLIKRISAKMRLSVQVHPNEVTAKTVGGEPKTEMWCVLEPGVIFAGFRPGTTAVDIERAVVDGSFEDLLMRYDAKPGECYFIPGGLVHAIGEGTVVYEVQQSSNTTFRLYDWGRLGADGRPRQLHVKEGLQAMDLALQPPVPADHVECPYFRFRQIEAGPLPASDRLRVIYTPSTEDAFLLAAGESASLPAPSFVTDVL